MQYDDTFLENLRSSNTIVEQKLHGEYDYDILSNEKYRNMLNFIPLELREYKEKIIDYDVHLTKSKFAPDEKYLTRRKIDDNDCIFYILSIGSNTYINKSEFMFEN